MKVGKSVSSKARDLVWYSVRSSVINSLNRSVSITLDSVDRSVWDSVRNSVPSSNNMRQKSAKKLIAPTIDEL